jgi:hypothetical protein
MWSVCAGGGVGCCVSRTLAADNASRLPTADLLFTAGVDWIYWRVSVADVNRNSVANLWRGEGEGG